MADQADWNMLFDVYHVTKATLPDDIPELFPLLVFDAESSPCVALARSLVRQYLPPVVLGVYTGPSVPMAGSFGVVWEHQKRETVTAENIRVLFERGMSELTNRVRLHDKSHDQLSVNLMRRLISAYSVDEIKAALCAHVQQVSGASEAVVWQQVLPGEGEQAYTAAAESALAERLAAADDGTLLPPLAASDFDGAVPLRLTADAQESAELERLFRVMESDELLVSPLQSAFIQGYLLVVPRQPGAIAPAGLRVIGQMVEDTSHMLERQLLTDWTERKTDWLETAANHISEGIIYVGASGQVDYVNRQFAEQSGLAIKQLVGLQQDGLLRQLASQDEKPEQALAVLQTFFQNAMHGNGEKTIALCGAGGAVLQLEVQPLEAEMWLGVLKSLDNVGKRASYRVLSHLKTHHSHAVSLLRVLMNEGQTASAIFREQMQSNLVTTLKQLGDLLDDALTSTAETPRLDLTAEDTPVDLYALVKSIVVALESDAVTVTTPDYPLEIDGAEGELRQVVQRLLTYLLGHTQDAPVEVTFRREKTTVQIRFNHALSSTSRRQLNWVLANDTYDHSSGVALDDHVSLSVVKACLVEHSARMWTEPSAVIVELPAPALSTVAPVMRETNKAPVERLLVCRQRSQIMTEAIYALRERGYELQICDNMDEALSFLDDLSAFDLVIVDGKYLRDGRQSLVHRIREQTYMPILVLDDSMNRKDSIEALKAGGDDHLTLPLSEDELLTKVRVLLRRKLDQANESLIEVGDLKIDLVNYRVALAGEPISFTHMEFKLLRVLAINAGQVLEHRQLMRLAWGAEYEDEKRQLWVYISRIRKKLEAPDDREYIQTRSGIGYLLK